MDKESESWKDFEKDRSKIWEKWERDFGYYIATTVKKTAEDGVLRELGITEADLDGDPDLKESFLDKLDRCAEGIVFYLKQTLYTSSNAPPVKTKKTSQKPIALSRWRRQLFERRLQLVTLVDESRERSKSTRISWKRITAEWNKAHPLDLLEATTILKRLYYRADAALRAQAFIIYMKAQMVMRASGQYELRSGKCPDCDTLFDDSENKPRGDKRYCPACKQYKIGNLKQIGKLLEAQNER